MRLLKPTGDQWEYELTGNEALGLKMLLTSFPVTRLFPVKMSKGTHDADSLDRELLLNQSLETHRNGLKTAAGRLLKECLHPTGDVWKLTLDPTAKENLLQILNDDRVSCWRALGEPEDIHQRPPGSPARLQLWSTMSVAGFFEEMLLRY